MDIKEIFNIVKTHMPITTDSRDCPEGSVFLALKGETFDGNKFAVSALQKGCAIAIVDDTDIIGTSGEQVVFNDNGTAEISLENGRQGMLILVDNTLQTYKDLAREHRRQFNIPVVGVTGTNGRQPRRNSLLPCWARNTTCTTPEATSTMMWECQRRCSNSPASTRLQLSRWVHRILAT